MNLSTHLRMAFHDWMWEAESMGRRIARRLPLYFSDPEVHGLRSESLEWAETTLPAAVEVWPVWNQTTNGTTATATNVTSTWPPRPDNPLL